MWAGMRPLGIPTEDNRAIPLFAITLDVGHVRVEHERQLALGLASRPRRHTRHTARKSTARSRLPERIAKSLVAIAGVKRS
jgi:hypothetical protein